MKVYVVVEGTGSAAECDGWVIHLITTDKEKAEDLASRSSKYKDHFVVEEHVVE
jgi:hypothetical protein